MGHRDGDIGIKYPPVSHGRGKADSGALEVTSPVAAQRREEPLRVPENRFDVASTSDGEEIRAGVVVRRRDDVPDDGPQPARDRCSFVSSCDGGGGS